MTPLWIEVRKNVAGLANSGFKQEMENRCGGYHHVVSFSGLHGVREQTLLCIIIIRHEKNEASVFMCSAFSIHLYYCTNIFSSHTYKCCFCRNDNSDSSVNPLCAGRIPANILHQNETIELFRNKRLRKTGGFYWLVGHHMDKLSADFGELHLL